jgi:hypothetical protein
MTILLELDPETEARLKANAERNGVAPEQYAGQFLRENLPDYGIGTGVLKPGDVEAMTKELTEGSKDLPILPPDATDRGSFYEDRW